MTSNQERKVKTGRLRSNREAPVGDLYVFEGPDGVGKSTLAKSFVKSLVAAGTRSRYFPFPGIADGSLGKLVYDLHHSPSRFQVDSVDQTSLQTLHIAAHIDLIETRIKPSIDDGITVVLDRYWWSTLAYGKVMGGKPRSLKMLVDLELLHWNGIKPTVVFLVKRLRPIGVAKNSTWKKVLLEYVRIAREERKNYPVHVIRNDSSVSEAAQVVRECTVGIQKLVL